MIIGGLGLGAVMLLITLAEPVRKMRTMKTRQHPEPFTMAANGDPVHLMPAGASRQSGRAEDTPARRRGRFMRSEM
jgi:hypothetical protein